MNIIHRKNRRWNVTILRHDGTPVLYEKVKHILNKKGYIEIYLGEHNIDREMVWFPVERIDHVIIQEINDG